MARDERSKITAEQNKKVDEWFDKFKATWSCSICGSRDWNVDPYLVEIRPFLFGDLDLGGGSYPNIMILCRVCGHVVLVNALTSGILALEDHGNAK